MMASAKIVLCDDPYVDWEGDTMEFRLTYEGPLLADTNDGKKVAGRARHKQDIRKAFHPQLRRLWSIHPSLSGNLGDIDDADVLIGFDQREVLPHKVDNLSKRFALNGYNFVPLVTRRLGVHCALDILFLRVDPPGQIFHHGDIDNRIKTLVDGLKMPTEQSQLGGYDDPDDNEKPFFCLVEDDSLITRFSVQTDTLLEPLHSGLDTNDSRVVITVLLKPYVVTVFNQVFG